MSTGRDKRRLAKARTKKAATKRLTKKVTEWLKQQDPKK